MQCPECGMRYADFFKSDTLLSAEEQDYIFVERLAHPDRLSEAERKKLFACDDEQICPECLEALQEEEGRHWSRTEDNFFFDTHDPRSPFFECEYFDEHSPLCE